MTMRAAYKTVLWWLEQLRWVWWRLGRPVRRLRRRFRNCGHPCCVNKVPHNDMPDGVCPCLDWYRDALNAYVTLYKEIEKERETEEFWKNYRT